MYIFWLDRPGPARPNVSYPTVWRESRQVIISVRIAYTPIIVVYGDTHLLWLVPN